ncbi:hypothetical protein BJF85_24315 [Saccharomonospora sp. CUA-673]|uniref:hypothetical protein n=1 Tax=Saccharomonospora sp. CUA-673 TaxID=1904969 RepID=UPI00095E81B1|nr:hypothetical protein [Saccharomonospora sp. CUA-673]OLT41251.1 hypothetical protein BJF85_24315 [Saccharomonospora sp. CUA-673]
MTAGGGHEVQTGELRGYRGLIDRQAEHFTTINDHAQQHGADTSGYTGLLALLAPAVTGVAALYGETLNLANRKMLELGEKLEDAATKYDTNEQETQSGIAAIGSSLEATDTPTIGGR